MGKTALTTFIILAGIIYLVFIAGLFLFIFQYRKRKIIHENEKQILAMDSIIQGQELERSRMAKDLHDGLGGMLSGIKLNLSSMKGNMIVHENDAQLFTKSIVQLDNAITEMRRVAHNMMPEALLKFGLTEAVQDYCDGINESHLIKMKFTTIGLNQPLEKPTEVILYRIIQELSNNALKHAAAENIFIQLNNHGQGITLTVEDDGKGFDELQITKGAGLQNVQSRIDYLKGQMEINSKPSEGSTFIIEIPLQL
jgi:signal transduction histidine kinase